MRETIIVKCANLRFEKDKHNKELINILTALMNGNTSPVLNTVEKMPAKR